MNTYQQANEDLGDISALEKFPPFNRYWMRRLKQRYDEINDKFHHETCTHEQREVYRQQLKLLEEIRDFTSRDKMSAQGAINAAASAPTRPIQVA